LMLGKRGWYVNCGHFYVLVYMVANSIIQEERKDEIRKKKRKNRPERSEEEVPKTSKPFKASKKRVSFG
jgi:hypothetical protein